MRRRCKQVFDVCTYLPLNGTSPFRSSDAAPLRRTNARTLRRHRFEIHCNFRQIQSMLSIAVERAAGVGAARAGGGGGGDGGGGDGGVTAVGIFRR